jgi:hypothetical protein
VVGVGGADEPGGVLQLGHGDRVAVHPVAHQPGAVVLEVLADRADEHRVQSQAAHPERDVGGDSSPAYVEVLDQEGQ